MRADSEAVLIPTLRSWAPCLWSAADRTARAGATGLPAAFSQLALLGALHSLTSGFFM